MALVHWLQLSLTNGIGPVLARRIVDAAGSAEAACTADAALLKSVEGIGAGRSTRIASSLREAAASAQAELALAQNQNVTILCPDDQTYPLLLREIPDPPVVLYVRGTLEPRDLNGVAIVGSRRCSFYGREQAERFAGLLGAAGITVISGGARGVDSSAHRGALAYPQGRTIAVLGSGVDVAYPPENEPLFRQIAQRGTVVSEFPLGTGPARENFPRRNRIISGMSRGVLIVEADERSGALITARQAYDDQNRPVFALPGRVDSPLSAGPHQLIRDGAVLVTRLDDILEALHPLPPSALQPQPATIADSDPAASKSEALPPSPRFLDLSDSQKAILTGLGSDTSAVDELVERTGLAASVVLRELTFLTLKGAVRRVDGQSFARGRLT